ncbi:MAG: hypothetical protein H2049_00375 [Porphyrobacter sp.]|nr:hypothetical protein [Porphyrobacter sp.]
MTDPRKPIFDAVRAAAPAGLFNDRGNILALDNLLDAFSVPRPGQAARPAPRLSSAPLSSPEPRWMSEARARIGEREIPGPRHNSWIAQSWGRLGARWFNDDETPWCGLFVAHCLDWAGFQIPPASQFPRALAWNDSRRRASLDRVPPAAFFAQILAVAVGALRWGGERVPKAGEQLSHAVSVSPCAQPPQSVFPLSWPRCWPFPNRLQQGIPDGK